MTEKQAVSSVDGAAMKLMEHALKMNPLAKVADITIVQFEDSPKNYGLQIGSMVQCTKIHIATPE